MTKPWRWFLLVALWLPACSGDPLTPPTDAHTDAQAIAADIVADGAAAPDTALGICENVTDGATCDDGDPCTLKDRCAGGFCVGGSNEPCSSENACETGTCVAGVGCQFDPVPDGTSCIAHCFQTATCDAGACAVDADSATVCAAPDASAFPCLDSLACDTATGLCDVPVHKPTGATCDTDSDLCSLETCDADGACAGEGATESCDTEKVQSPCEHWVCIPKTGDCSSTGFVGPISCNDGQSCTINDICQQDAFNFISCKGDVIAVDDGNPCTNDYCLDGAVSHDVVTGAQCASGDPCAPIGTCSADGACEFQNGCECFTDQDCVQPDDLCAGQFVCDTSQDAWSCALKPGTVVECPASADGCLLNSCVAETGACAPTPGPDGLGCTDGSACTVGTQCTGGLCSGGQAVLCDDEVFCNGAESCLPAQGCVAGDEPGLNDGLDCTLDGCEESTQTITHTPVNAECDDGDFCNGPESCDAASGCQGGPAPMIDDEVACTVDACEAGGITHTASDAFCAGLAAAEALCVQPTCAGAAAGSVGCTFELKPNCCGNGVKEPGELCDDGNADDTDSCTSECSLILAPECFDPIILDSYWRNTAFNDGVWGFQNCDLGLNGWVRFQGEAGTQMPTGCTVPYACGTDGAGWLTGGHPTWEQNLVTRLVCFSFGGDCCAFETSVQVRHCGTYYVYSVFQTPGCNLGYCGETVTSGPVHTFEGHASEFFATEGACGEGGAGDAEVNAEYFCKHFYGEGWTAVDGSAFTSTANADDEFVMHRGPVCSEEGEAIANTFCEGGPCQIGMWDETLTGIRGIVCEQLTFEP